MNPEKLKKEKEEPSVGLTDEQLTEWYDARSDRYDLSIERGKDALIEYFKESFKSTSVILKKNTEFFNSLGNVTKVIVLGHSLAEVDEPYFIKIISSTNTDAKWIVSYHYSDEIESRKKRLIQLGLKEEQISLITMEDLK